jgi:hypothetical protein
MPDGTGHTQFKNLEVHVVPAQCQQFADAKPGCCIEQNQRSLPHFELAEEKLDL